MKVLTIKDLAYTYKEGPTFRYPDFSCEAGDQKLILGNSGSGKSTLLHLLGLILPIQSGLVSIEGTDVNHLSASKTTTFRAKNIGIVFQQHHFIKALSVKDNLLLANYYAKKAPNRKGLEEIGDRLGIAPLLRKSVFELSGGEMQRVGIARALMNEPKLILADEPTSSLDDKNCNNVFKLLSETAKEIKSALIIVTHDARLKEKVPTQIQL